MKRREFLASSLAASAGGGFVAAGELGVRAAETQTSPEYYELRLYHLRRGPKVRLADEFFREAAVPALNRAGIKPVGVFNVTIGPSNPTVYLLVPYPSLESVATIRDRLFADAEYQKRGADFLNAFATDPAYVRVESSLMVAFPSMPRLEVPAATAEKGRRIFELRTYESHSRKAHLKKIEMFTSEIAIFRRAGLRPVFFGSTLIGSKLPNLTYMLSFASMEEHDRAWAAFSADPEWKKLSTTPGYTDGEIVSNISNAFLTPTSYSQI